MANTQTEAFGAVGNGTAILIKSGEDYTYSVTGGATATVVLQRSTSAGSTWETLVTATANTGPTTVNNDIANDALFRWICTAYTSGTATCNIKSATSEFADTVVRPNTSENIYEQTEGVARRTVIECNALSVTISDDAGVAQYGGVKVYDFPEGMILLKGAQVNGILTAGVTGTIIDNWDGDVALGSATATTGATLTGTEADYMPSVAVSAGASDKLGVVDAVSVATALTESGARWLDGTATAKDMYLNFVIDDDATHTAGTATFTGTIVFTWEQLGDN